MLDFETCKRLKEAGFPQQWAKGDQYFYEGRKGRWLVDSALRIGTLDPEKTIKIPSLEDLLRELGEDFNSLVLTGENLFQANGLNAEGYLVCSSRFQFPDAAVADLWLVLHPSK